MKCQNLLKSIVVLLFIFPNSAHPQEVLKTLKNLVLLNIDQTAGLNTGDEVFLLRKLDSGEILKVGKVKIIRFRQGKCSAKLIAIRRSHKIQTGDFVEIPTITVGKKSNFLSYTFLAAGVLATGGAYAFKSQANQTFLDYEAAKISEDAVQLYGETTSFDRKAKISIGVGGGLIVLGAITYLMNRSKPSMYTNKSFSIKPVQNKQYTGFRLSIPLGKK